MSDQPAQKKRRRGKRPSQKAVQEPEQVQFALTQTPQAEDEPSFYGKLREETAQYFKSIEPMLRNALADEDQQERSLLVENVLDECDGAELIIATDFSGSRILERIIQLANGFQLRVLMERMRGQFVILMRHRFASHVLQTLFLRCLSVMNQELNQDVQTDQSGLPSMVSLYEIMLAEVQGSVESLVVDPYGSHILRQLFASLAGSLLTADERANGLARSNMSQKYVKGKKLAVDNEQLFDVVCAKFAPQFSIIVNILADYFDKQNIVLMAQHQVASPLLSLLIVMLGKFDYDKYIHLVKKILRLNDDGSLLDGSSASFKCLICSPAASHLLQFILNADVLPEVLMQSFFTLMSHDISYYCQNQYANYVVQTYMDNIKGENLALQILNVMSNLSFIEGMLFQFQRLNIILHLIDICTLCCLDQQKQLAGTIRTLFFASDTVDKDKIWFLLSFKPQQLLIPVSQLKFSSPGSQLTAKLLNMKHQSVLWLTELLLLQSSDTLVSMAQHSTASRVLQALFQSPTVAPKTKQRIWQPIRSHAADLALDRCGSYVIEAIWSCEEVKLALMKELISKQDIIQTSVIGKKLMLTFEMNLYKQSPQVWRTKHLK